MGFWIFMLAMALLQPLLMIFFGRRFLHRPPEDPGLLYGYRTYRSMKNKDTWNFAHRYFGKLWYRAGLWCLAPTLVPLLLVMGRGDDAVGMTGSGIMMLQLIPLILPIFFTERALKRTFDQEGRPREKE